MSKTIACQITRDDGRVRLTVHQRDDGCFLYTEDSFEAWDDAPAMWVEGYPPSGLFASMEQAEEEAKAIIPWLRAHVPDGC